MKLNQPIKDIYPKTWMGSIGKSIDNFEFRNLIHFKSYVSKLKQIEDNTCDVSYSTALDELLKEKSQISDEEYQLIRNLVRSNLLKRGLITSDVYERYEYAVDGQIVDIAKVVEDDPMCFLTPVKSYTNYFYELYVSVSYPAYVPNKVVKENCIKLLSTIEELERQHIYIKVTLVHAARSVSTNDDNMFVTIPLFSHKQPKSARTMSSVINDRLLRKFIFAIKEDHYKEKLSYGYGLATELDNAINIGDTLNEIELFTTIYDQVITPGSR